MSDINHSLQFSMTPDFSLANRLGFTTPTINKGTVRDSLQKLSQLATAGNIVAVPGAEVSVDELQSMVALQPGEAKPSDGFGYTVIPCFVRVVTNTNGVKRSGAESLQLPEGISDVGAGDIIS